ncbi:hypothetical protein ACHAW5_002095 [Stephanodiscus triporus]|uniref:Uncharacterized protein n=1 Tax=Stephanodiscus triporus TaxID=2934178 RepID=A0ABD3NDH4_9STRA
MPSTFVLFVAILLPSASLVGAFSPARQGLLIEPTHSPRRIYSAALSSSSPSSSPTAVNDHDDHRGDAPSRSKLASPAWPRQTTRRTWIRTTASFGVVAAGLLPVESASSASAQPRAPTTSSSGLLPDLPPEAVRSYLQYRYPLQLAADYYVFDLQNMVRDPDEFGAVNELVSSKGSRGGAGGASRIERDYVNPMRIIGLSMPPEYADDIRDSQFAFERAMSRLTKATSGVQRGLSVEIDRDAVPNAVSAWEEGRLALNSFFVTLNSATGLEGELKVIPPPGPDQTRQYGRSLRRYNEFTKKTRLCQNRGGPTLSAAWGQLMVSGYLQDSRKEDVDADEGVIAGRFVGRWVGLLESGRFVGRRVGLLV